MHEHDFRITSSSLNMSLSMHLIEGNVVEEYLSVNECQKQTGKNIRNLVNGGGGWVGERFYRFKQETRVSMSPLALLEASEAKR